MMRSVTTIKILLLILACSTYSGCMYGPHPGYGGYRGYPYGSTYPGYQAPAQTLTPGPQYVPNGTVTPGAVLPGATPTYQNNGLTPIGPGGANTNAPPFSSSENTNPVPDPTNSSGSPFYDGDSSTFLPPRDSNILPANHQNTFDSPQPLNLTESDLNAPSSPTAAYSPQPMINTPDPMSSAIDVRSLPQDIPSVPPVNDSSQPFPVLEPPTSTEAPAEPLQPRPLPAIDNISSQRTFNKPVADAAHTFAHHPQYKWLRGVVSRDQPTGTWSIIYSDNPKASDKFAGHLSLAANPYLKNLRDGDVVEIQGEIDPVIKDPQGKPTFLVTQLKTITKAPTR